jgi:hypothetical protein
MKFPILTGADAQTMKQFGLEEIAPSTVFIDRDGTIVFRIIGEARRNDVLDRVQWLLGAREGERPAAVVDRSKKR